MQRIMLDLWLGGPKKGIKIQEVISRIYKYYFLEPYEITSKGTGYAAGCKFPDFGKSLAFIVIPENSIALYDREDYINVHVATYMPEKGNRKEHLEILNNPDLNIVSMCTEFRDALQRAFGSTEST